MPVLFTPSDPAARAAPAVNGVSAVAAPAAAAPVNNVRRVSAVIPILQWLPTHATGPRKARDYHHATAFVPFFGWTARAARIGLQRSNPRLPAGPKPDSFRHNKILGGLHASFDNVGRSPVHRACDKHGRLRADATGRTRATVRRRNAGKDAVRHSLRRAAQ